MSKAPHFKFYPNDFMGGVAYLTMEERGAYITLLCLQWDSGPIPKKRLGFLLGSDWQTVWNAISEKFKETTDDRIFNERLELERQKSIEFAEKQRINGKKGGRNKAKGNPTLNPKESLLDNDNDSDSDSDNDSSFEKSEKLFSGKTELMGFKGRCRVWLQKEHRYVWGKEDDFAIEDLHRKIKQLLELEIAMTSVDIEVARFQLIITNLDPWVKASKFSLKYLNEHFNEIKNGKSTKAEPGSSGHGSGKRDKIDEWYPKSTAGRA